MQNGDIPTVSGISSLPISANFALPGDIIYLRIFGNPIMVINSPDVAEDLLEGRSKKYSSRFVPSFQDDGPLDAIPGPSEQWSSNCAYRMGWLTHLSTNSVDSMGWDWLFSTMPYGPRWRDHRSLFHRHFRRHMTSGYYPIILKETRTTLRNLLDSPQLYAHHIRRYALPNLLNLLLNVVSQVSSCNYHEDIIWARHFRQG